MAAPSGFSLNKPLVAVSGSQTNKIEIELDDTVSQQQTGTRWGKKYTNDRFVQLDRLSFTRPCLYLTWIRTHSFVFVLNAHKITI